MGKSATMAKSKTHIRNTAFRYGMMADATIGHNSRVMLKATSVALAGMSSYSRLSLLKESAAERKIR